MQVQGGCIFSKAMSDNHQHQVLRPPPLLLAPLHIHLHLKGLLDRFFACIDPHLLESDAYLFVLCPQTTFPPDWHITYTLTIIGQMRWVWCTMHNAHISNIWKQPRSNCSYQATTQPWQYLTGLEDSRQIPFWVAWLQTMSSLSKSLM